MKGDFSRDTFDPVKHFSRVLQQQGRVQLDADWNEQASILLHYLRTLTADLIGPFAGPAGDNWGFGIVNTEPPGPNNFFIGRGRYYVDGILCENETNITYRSQKYYPNPPVLGDGDYLVYLDVWERHITAVEDDYIREKALGGPDTSSRTQIIWQVKIDDRRDPGEDRRDPGEDSPLSLVPVKKVHENWSKWIERWQPPRLGCLKARVERPEDSNDPCLTAPDAKYRGQENQLYRIEIHKEGSAEEATFKWSRDNGAIVTRVERSGSELIARNPRGFAVGSWVELTNDEQELRGEPGTLIQLRKVEGDRLTLQSPANPPEGLPDGENWPTKARRWDHRETDRLDDFSEGDKRVKEAAGDAGWIELENGIQIQFLSAAEGDLPNTYRTGDYWLIPARVATGNIEWPVKLGEDGKPKRDRNGNVIPVPRAPFGIRHHYAPLAIRVGDPIKYQNLRCQFSPSNACGLSYSYGEEGIGAHLLCVEKE